MIEAAKDSRHAFISSHIVECKEADEKLAVHPDAGHAGMSTILTPYGEQDQLRAWVHDAPITDVGDKRRG